MSQLGHRERLRGRFEVTPETLAEYEILELLLGYVLIRRDTKPIAKALLERCGSLSGVLRAQPVELEDLPGVGPGVHTFLALLREFMSRAAEQPLKQRDVLCSPEEVAAMARQRLGFLTHEEMWVAFLDNTNRMLHWERAAKGTINATAVFPRDIIERALQVKASGLILVHNHPAGTPAASGADIDLTKRIQAAGQPLGIRLIDHVIVTDTVCYSIMTDGIVLS